jgi:hypothetical protein
LLLLLYTFRSGIRFPNGESSFSFATFADLPRSMNDRRYGQSIGVQVQPINDSSIAYPPTKFMRKTDDILENKITYVFPSTGISLGFVALFWSSI